ncbi:MAG TPA: ABC transporter permease [Candidatus Saccharimonadales bacterium]|jgi:putative ABC transport system permease protein|nr:ABC transporter permease [Candidatus Saccharimonadales bacterium]
MSATRGGVKMAIASVRSTKWRSLLTMLGVIIGIVAVVTTVGIGEGVKHQVAGQISHFGKDLITVRPGHITGTNAQKTLSSTNLFSGITNGPAMNAQDLQTVQKTKHVAQSAPLSAIPGDITVGSSQFGSTPVLATTADLPSILNQKVQYGAFFTSDEESQAFAVLGIHAAQALFQEESPLGMSFSFRGQTFIVRGVFDDFADVPLSPVADFNNAVFISYPVASQLTNQNAQIYAILAKPDTASNTDTAIKTLNSNLLTLHGGQQDFSVLNQKQTIAATGDVLDLLTKLVSGVAAISLLVGGVGIMNVMLVSVTERMHEIGVRKAIGATNRQILHQFVLEAAVLSVTGGGIGIVISLLISLLLHTYTDLKPVISWQAIVVATGVSLLVGIVFGAAPAIKAARKDPIDALRHE